MVELVSTSETTAPAGTVQSVARAFALLEALAVSDGESTLASLASDTDLAVPTAHRLLGTLHRLGYVRQLEDRRYALGAGLIGLGRQAVPHLADAAVPLLVRLEDASTRPRRRHGLRCNQGRRRPGLCADSATVDLRARRRTGPGRAQHRAVENRHLNRPHER